MEGAVITPQMESEIRSHGANVERTSLRVIREQGSAAPAMQRAQEMYDSVMKKVDTRYAFTYACKPGCAHCCAAEVTVTAPEVDLLVQHLSATRTPEQINQLKARMRGVLEERQAGGRPRCAFLEDSRCTIYAVRPMKCRACNAIDVEPCQRWEEGGDETACMQVVMPPRLYAMMTVFGVLKAAAPQQDPRHAPHTELMSTLLVRL